MSGPSRSRFIGVSEDASIDWGDVDPDEARAGKGESEKTAAPAPMPDGPFVFDDEMSKLDSCEDRNVE